MLKRIQAFIPSHTPLNYYPLYVGAKQINNLVQSHRANNVPTQVHVYNKNLPIHKDKPVYPELHMPHKVSKDPHQLDHIKPKTSISNLTPPESIVPIHQNKLEELEVKKGRPHIRPDPTLNKIEQKAKENVVNHIKTPALLPADADPLSIESRSRVILWGIGLGVVALVLIPRFI